MLYELFTGRPVFEGKSAAEFSSLHRSAMPSSLTTHVHSLDPTIERAVLRCLEKSPSDRPSSALVVSAALPGGDPLAAALGNTYGSAMDFAAGLRRFAVFMVVLLRWGVLALLVAVMTIDLAWMARVPDVEHWTAEGARLAIALLGLMAAFAAWAATGTGSERRDR